jgi:hypothetical protein
MYIYSIYPAARRIHSPPIIDFILGTGKILDSIVFMNTLQNAIQPAIESNGFQPPLPQRHLGTLIQPGQRWVRDFTRKD